METACFSESSIICLQIHVVFLLEDQNVDIFATAITSNLQI